jgi:hypothetical protein
MFQVVKECKEGNGTNNRDKNYVPICALFMTQCGWMHLEPRINVNSRAMRCELRTYFVELMGVSWEYVFQVTYFVVGDNTYVIG